MRTLILSLGALCLATASQAALIGHWKFDEASGLTANDSSGQGNHGNLNGAVTLGSAGIAGNAATFAPGSTGYIRMGNVHGLTASSFTLSAWVKTTSTSSMYVAGKHDAGYFNGYFLGTGTGGGYGTPNKAYAYQSNAPGGEPISTSNVNTGAWWHVAMVYNIPSNTTTIYMNGVLEHTRPRIGIGSNPRDFTVGGLFNGGQYVGAYEGMIDDVQLYDQALTSNQVEFLFRNPGAPVPEPATVALLGLGAAALIRRRRSV